MATTASTGELLPWKQDANGTSLLYEQVASLINTVYYLLLIPVATVGNLLTVIVVVYIVRHQRRRRNVPDLCLGVLALVDLGSILFVHPVTLASLYATSWRYPAWVCLYQGYVASVYLKLEFLVQVLISLDRHFALVKPLRYHSFNSSATFKATVTSAVTFAVGTTSLSFWLVPDPVTFIDTWHFCTPATSFQSVADIVLNSIVSAVFVTGIVVFLVCNVTLVNILRHYHKQRATSLLRQISDAMRTIKKQNHHQRRGARTAPRLSDPDKSQDPGRRGAVRSGRATSGSMADLCNLDNGLSHNTAAFDLRMPLSHCPATPGQPQNIGNRFPEQNNHRQPLNRLSAVVGCSDSQPSAERPLLTSSDKKEIKLAARQRQPQSSWTEVNGAGQTTELSEERHFIEVGQRPVVTIEKSGKAPSLRKSKSFTDVPKSGSRARAAGRCFKSASVFGFGVNLILERQCNEDTPTVATPARSSGLNSAPNGRTRQPSFHLPDGLQQTSLASKQQSTPFGQTCAPRDVPETDRSQLAVPSPGPPLAPNSLPRSPAAASLANSSKISFSPSNGSWDRAKTFYVQQQMAKLLKKMEKKARKQKKELLLAKMVLFCATLFVITWLPYITVTLLSFSYVHVPTIVTDVALKLVFLNAFLNPVFYGLCRKTYRNGFSYLIQMALYFICCGSIQKPGDDKIFFDSRQKKVKRHLEAVMYVVPPTPRERHHQPALDRSARALYLLQQTLSFRPVSLGLPEARPQEDFRPSKRLEQLYERYMLESDTSSTTDTSSVDYDALVFSDELRRNMRKAWSAYISSEDLIGNDVDYQDEGEDHSDDDDDIDLDIDYDALLADGGSGVMKMAADGRADIGKTRMSEDEPSSGQSVGEQNSFIKILDTVPSDSTNSTL